MSSKYTIFVLCFKLVQAEMADLFKSEIDTICGPLGKGGHFAVIWIYMSMDVCVWKRSLCRYILDM